MKVLGKEYEAQTSDDGSCRLGRSDELAEGRRLRP